MRIRSDGAITGMVGLGPLWRWLPSDDRPVLLGVDGGAACWHGNDMMAVISEPMVGIVRFGVNGGYTVADPRIPNDLRAEGKHWLASSSTPRKTWGSLRGAPFFYDGVSVIALDADGSYVIAGEATNFRHVIVWSNGHEVTLPYGESIVRLKDGIAMGRANNRITLHTPNGRLPTSSNRADRGTIQVLPGETWPIMAFLSPQAFWLMYAHETMGIVLHPTDSAKWGRRWTTPMHGIDVKVEGGDLLMAWATQEGDRADAARRVTIPLGKLLDDDLTPILPQPSVVAPAGPVVMAGAFFTTAATPGNASIWVRGPLPAGKAVFAPIELADQVPTEYLAGLWVAHERPDAHTDILLEQRIAQSRIVAERLKVPMLVYDDQRVYRTAEIRAWCGAAPWIACPQWYIRASEDPGAFATDVSTHLAGLDGVPLMPAIRVYTGSGAVPVSQVQAAMNALAQSSRVDGFFLFAWDRADGVTGVPALQPWADAWLTTSTTLRPPNARAWAASLFPRETLVIPDHFSVVQAVFDAAGVDLTTHTGCGLFVESCARALHAVDPRWGNLLKKPGQNQYDGHAVDCVLYRSDAAGQSVAVDIIKANATPEAVPSWGPDIPRYSPEDWAAPETIQPSLILRPALPTLRGMTAFDWLTHQSKAWTDLHTQYGLPVLRLVPQSRFRSPRSLSDGIAQLDAGLARLAGTGLKALVVINCDTREYGMTEQDIRDNTRAINAVMVKHLPVVVAASLGNENSHGVEQPCMRSWKFLRELDALVDPRIPLSWGAFWGVDAEALSNGGSWIACHSDRGKTPEENGRIMWDLQSRAVKPVVDQEPLGAAEPGTQGQRYFDLAYARRLGEAAKPLRGGIIFHCEAGLYADVAKFGPNHRACASALLAGLGQAVPPVQPPVPPPGGHPILDAPLSPAIPVGYKFFIANGRAIETEARAWYLRWSKGRPPADTDVFHGIWRALYEGDRWKTLRAAWTEAWPGGEHEVTARPIG